MIVKLPGFIQWVARTMKFGHPLTEHPMSLDDFRQSLSEANHLRTSHPPPSPDFGGTPKAIGSGLTSLHSRTKAPRVRGCIPTCVGLERRVNSWRTVLGTTPPVLRLRQCSARKSPNCFVVHGVR